MGNYANISVKPLHEHRQVSRRDREPSRIPIRTVERLKNKSRKVRMFVYGRISSSIPKVYPNCIVMRKLKKKKK